MPRLMIEGYVDSVVPSFSDDDDESKSLSVPVIRFQGERVSVPTVVLAGKPSSATVLHFACNASRTGDLYMNDRIVGKSFVSGQVGYICLAVETSVILNDIFTGFNRVIVLVSRQAPQSQMTFISTDPEVKLNGISSMDSPLTGMAARVFTESVMSGYECVVIINEHRPIRVEAHGIIELYSSLSQLVPLPVKQEEFVMSSFKKLVPINSRVPLYS